MFAAIAEVIHYYIDNVAREAFFSSARRYESLVKHSRLVDYHIKAAVAPMVDVVVTRPFTSDQFSAEVLITKGSSFTDNSGNTWQSTKDVKWYANTTDVTIPVAQHTLYDDTRMIGTVIPNMKVSGATRAIQVPSLGNGSYYEEGTMNLSIADTDWALVETFAFSGPYDKVFKVEPSSNGDVFIIFGDGTHGGIPDPGYQITTCNYYITKGDVSNVLEGQIQTLPSVITNKVSDAVCTNPYSASGGSKYETFDMLKEHVPLFVRTLGVAITKQDFVDLAMSVPGVNKCAVEYECGRKLNLYISPDNGEVASSALIESVYNYIMARCTLTTWLTVYTAGVTYINLDIEVTGRKSFSADSIHDQILTALKDKYSIQNSSIGGSVRISDIYALIDGLSMVDYLTINNFYLKPWPKTLYGNAQLIISNFILIKANGSMEYLIAFTSSTEYEIRSKSNGYYAVGETGKSQRIVDTDNNFEFSLGIQSSSNYQSGYRYSITISEANKDYVEPGFNLPVFSSDDQLTLTVNETV
jgi:hypothetical protein